MTPIRRSTQAGRRGVTRNLVGRESVARVRIPSPPPKITIPSRGMVIFSWGAGFEKSNPSCRVFTSLFSLKMIKIPGPIRIPGNFVGLGWKKLLLQGLLNSNSQVNGHDDHGVVTSAQEDRLIAKQEAHCKKAVCCAILMQCKAWKKS